MNKYCPCCGEQLEKGEVHEAMQDERGRWHAWHKTCPDSDANAVRAYRRADGLIVAVDTGEPPPSGTPYIVMWEG